MFPEAVGRRTGSWEWTEAGPQEHGSLLARQGRSECPRKEERAPMKGSNGSPAIVESAVEKVLRFMGLKSTSASITVKSWPPWFTAIVRLVIMSARSEILDLLI